jgi:lysozyme
MSADFLAAEIISRFEGCRLSAYLCPAGKETIGYGHTGPDVLRGMVITQEQADSLLAADIERFSSGVANLVKQPLNECQQAALISFAFNLGLDRLQRSTLLLMVNSGDHLAAAKEFLKWVYANGKILPGLVERRKAESELYLRDFPAQ